MNCIAPLLWWTKNRGEKLCVCTVGCTKVHHCAMGCLLLTHSLHWTIKWAKFNICSFEYFGYDLQVRVKVYFLSFFTLKATDKTADKSTNNYRHISSFYHINMQEQGYQRGNLETNDSEYVQILRSLSDIFDLNEFNQLIIYISPILALSSESGSWGARDLVWHCLGPSWWFTSRTRSNSG